MEIRAERFDDSSPPNPDGTFDYRYVGTTYIVSEGDRALLFRAYDEEPAIVTLISPVDWTPDDLRDGLLGTALRALHETVGVRRVRLYNPMTGSYTDEHVL